MTQDQWQRGEGWREDLTELCGFICDHMSAGEAGKACSLLSAVSRHSNALDRENEKLRELLGKVLTEYKSDRKCFDCDPELCMRCAERNGIWDGCLFDKEIRGAARKLGVTAC